MDAIEKLKQEELKLQEKLKRVRESMEREEQRIILKIPSILRVKYPEVYEEIRLAIIEEMANKKTKVKAEKAEGKKEDTAE